jgi:hypothetical protein
MKIIISESQYSNIFESNNEKQSNLIYKMWNDGMDIYEISELIGLKESQVVLYLKDKEIRISCDLSYIIIQILYRTSLINKNFNFNNGEMILNLKWGDFSGSVDFEYEDKKYILLGMATPYWDGNCSTPVDGSYFEDKNTEEHLDVYDNSGEYIKNTPTHFNSIQELIDFLNNDYPKQLIKPIQELISFYKNHIEKYKR